MQTMKKFIKTLFAVVKKIWKISLQRKELLKIITYEQGNSAII